jgi:hypothetical protein
LVANSSSFLCATRFLKNAKFLQSPAMGFFPTEEPLNGFATLLSAHLLRRLERILPEETGVETLAKVLAERRPPMAKATVVAPLFSGTLVFIHASFSSQGTVYSLPEVDIQNAIQYASLSVIPISKYASQYGPNKLAVSTGLVPFQTALTGAKFNDQTLAGWVDQLAKARGLQQSSCLVVLSPQGVVNTDADVTQGVLGYHSRSPSGIPYIFVNVLGQGLTIIDEKGFYALALSHEIAEMTVDPAADGSNPEVCDPCAGNCNKDYRDYFDQAGNWLGGSPTTGFAFFIDGIATPASVARCPAPESSCSYPPPKPLL